LDLSGTGITDVGLAQLARLKNLQTLALVSPERIPALNCGDLLCCTQ